MPESFQQAEDPKIRLALAALAAVFTTFAILWLMQILIATGKGAITSKYEGRFVDFVRKMKIEEVVEDTIVM